MRIRDWSSDVCSSDRIPVEQGDGVLERRDATDLGALRDYRVESRNPPQEREAERDRSHPAYLAERWIRESGIHAHLADEGGCQAQATFQDLRLPVDVARLCRRRSGDQARKQPADPQRARQAKFPGTRYAWFLYPHPRCFPNFHSPG